MCRTQSQTLTLPHMYNIPNSIETLNAPTSHQTLPVHKVMQYTNTTKKTYTNLSSNTTNTHTPTSHQTLPMHIHQPLVKHYQSTYTTSHQTLPMHIHQPLIKHYQCTYTNLSSNTTNAHTPTSHQTLPMHIHQPLIKHYQYMYNIVKHQPHLQQKRCI